MAAVIVSLAGLALVAALIVVVVMARRRSAARPADASAAGTPAGPVSAMPPRLPRPVRPTRPPGHPRAAPRPPTRPPHPVHPVAGGLGGASSPLAALSAVEKRGCLARVESVSFVDSGAVAPEVATAGGVPVAAVGDPTLVAADQAVKDQLELRVTRRLRTTCQIVYVDRLDDGTLIDLVTLDGCRLGAQAVPAGTALALGFGPVPVGADCQDLDAVMGYWEAIGAVVELEVVETARVARYRFACPEDGLALVVQSERA